MNILKIYNATMNLFKKIYTAISDRVKEVNREKQIKASYKIYIAQLEEELLGLEANLETKVKEEGYSFEKIVEIYQDILFKEDDIDVAKETYEHLFTEETED